MQRFIRPAKLFYFTFSKGVVGKARLPLVPLYHPIFNFPKYFSTEQKVNLVDSPSYKKQKEEAFRAFKEGRVHESVEKFADLLEQVVKAHGEQHKEVSDMLYYLGSSLFYDGNLEDPMELYSRGLKINKGLYGENNPDAPRFYLGIGMIFERKGQAEEALVYFEKARHIASIYGSAHPDLSTSLESIGRAATTLGRFDDAYEALTRCYELRVQAFGENSFYTAASHLDIGTLFRMQGRFNEALEHFNKTLAIGSKVTLRPQFYAVCNKEIGECYLNLGKYDLCLKHYDIALQIAIDCYGENHSEVGTMKISIGTALYQIGKHEKAMENLEAGLKILKKTLGENHPNVATVYNDMGLTVIVLNFY